MFVFLSLTKQERFSDAAGAGAAEAGAAEDCAAEAGAAEAGAAEAGAAEAGAAEAGAAEAGAAEAGAAASEATISDEMDTVLEYPYEYGGTAIATDCNTGLPTFLACMEYPESDPNLVFLQPIFEMLQYDEQPFYIGKKNIVKDNPTYKHVHSVRVQEPVLSQMVIQHLAQCDNEEAKSFIGNMIKVFCRTKQTQRKFLSDIKKDL